MKTQALGCLKIVLFTGGGIIALLVLLVVLSERKDDYNYHHGFDRQLWLETGRILRSDTADLGILGTSNPRQDMVRDVMAHHLKVGMTRAQVLALLGPPERDGIEMVVPDSVQLPDSLNDKKMTSQQILQQSPDSFNQWFAQHAQPDTLMRYWVGWAMIDPTSLRVEFGGTGRVKRYWVGIH